MPTGGLYTGKRLCHALDSTRSAVAKWATFEEINTLSSNKIDMVDTQHTFMIKTATLSPRRRGGHHFTRSYRRYELTDAALELIQQDKYLAMLPVEGEELIPEPTPTPDVHPDAGAKSDPGKKSEKASKAKKLAKADFGLRGKSGKSPR